MKKLAIVLGLILSTLPLTSCENYKSTYIKTIIREEGEYGKVTYKYKDIKVSDSLESNLLYISKNIEKEFNGEYTFGVDGFVIFPVLYADINYQDKTDRLIFKYSDKTNTAFLILSLNKSATSLYYSNIDPSTPDQLNIVKLVYNSAISKLDKEKVSKESSYYMDLY